ncbi:hypothetical protein HMPREF9120_02113 [Neisseria sp. oral taxon 020 str. F0370]|nr:hypothetical protein HMPREF9120_02113 [Neisseria sp. oral taxon 020 str. F0370]
MALFDAGRPSEKTRREDGQMYLQVYERPSEILVFRRPLYALRTAGRETCSAERKAGRVCPSLRQIR